MARPCMATRHKRVMLQLHESMHNNDEVHVTWPCVIVRVAWPCAVVRAHMAKGSMAARTKVVWQLEVHVQQRWGLCNSESIYSRMGNGGNGCHMDVQREKECATEHKDAARKTKTSVARDAKPAKKRCWQKWVKKKKGVKTYLHMEMGQCKNGRGGDEECRHCAAELTQLWEKWLGWGDGRCLISAMKSHLPKQV